MPPFAADFVPSKLRRCLAVLLFTCLLLCVVLYLSGSLKWLLLLASIIGFAYAWHEPQKRVSRVQINPKQHATVFYQQHPYHAKLLSGSLITPYACCLRWQLYNAENENNLMVYQWIFPDSTDKESQRRLRVWAMWAQYGQSQS